MTTLRISCLLLVVCGALSATDYPLWDSKESVADYAAHTGLKPSMKLDAGSGISVEAVLIPAGRFRMGAPEPQQPHSGPLELLVLCAGVVVIFSLAAIALWQALIRKQRVRFSLRALLLLTFVLAITLWAGVRTLQLSKQWRAYYIAMRYYRMRSYEQPDHEVTISKPFYMGKTEITQAQYQQIMGAACNAFAFNGAELPADSMRWDQACDCCKRLSASSGQRVRLPTEAEWEYACRAGSASIHYLGDLPEDQSSIANIASGRPQTTAQLKPNAFGLYDMLGNVWEWCYDWYDSEYYSTSPATDPQGPKEGMYHAIRGGSWLNNQDDALSASRWDMPFGNSSRDVGFRIAVDVEAQSRSKP